MIILENGRAYPFKSILFVFALESEAAEVFAQQNTLITGIGKVNATYQLTKAISIKKPALVVNLGSAGSTTFNKGEVVCCTSFIQRDMDVRGLGYSEFETPLSGLSPILQYGIPFPGIEEGICGTGDSFEMAHNKQSYNVLDMEAYALSLVCLKEEIPFLCLKYISDGADGNAADDWTEQVHQAAASFGSILGIRVFDVG